MSVLGDLPEGVVAAMFLRDGWPDAVVCKVLMKTGCIGIGIFRYSEWDARPSTPAEADAAAMADALTHVSLNPPDYTEIHEHAARMKAAADETARKQAIHDAGEEPDHDLQASLGQPAHS